MVDTTEPTGIGYELSHLTVEEASLIENLLDSVIKELFREAQRSGVTVAGLHITRVSGGDSGETVRIVVIPAGEEP